MSELLHTLGALPCRQLVQRQQQRGDSVVFTVEVRQRHLKRVGNELLASTASSRPPSFQPRLDWLAEAAALPGGKTLHLALLLQRLCAERGSVLVHLTRRMLAPGHVSRDACYDGLRRLERARLISVRRLPGRSPQVLLLEPGSVPSTARRLRPC